MGRTQKPTTDADRISAEFSEIGASLDQHFETSGKDFKQKLKNAKAQMPRKVRKTILEISKIEQKIANQPYLLESQKKTIQKARKVLQKPIPFEDNADKRSLSISNWLRSLVLNYLIFLIILVGFWYVGTKL